MITVEHPEMKILVRIKHQYGQQTVVPVCEIAQEFARIAGTSTLTVPTIESIKRLGYTVSVEQTLPTTL